MISPEVSRDQLTRQQLSNMLDEYRMIFARAVRANSGINSNELDNVVELHQKILDAVFP